MIEIRAGQRKDAFQAGLNAYKDQPQYISPMWSDFERVLNPAQNPLTRDGHGRFELFTAYRDQQPVGRIVATIHDASNTRHKTRRGQFGFFDCVDDPAVSAALLSAAETWACERGANELTGNFNLTAMQMAGVVTSDFENTPYTDMMWSPPYIAEHLKRLGYVATFPMTTFNTDLDAIDIKTLDSPRHANIENDPDYTWLAITRRTFKQRLNDARIVLNSGFDKNPMFVPLTEAEYAFQAGEMMWILDPRISIVAHYKGAPAGVVVCIPDLNPLMEACGSRLSWSAPWHFLRHRLTRDRAVIIYYSVAEHLHGRGINSIMLKKVITAAKAAGYRSLGTTWIADVNVASLKQMRSIGAKPLHRLSLFSKMLTGGA